MDGCGEDLSADTDHVTLFASGCILGKNANEAE